VRFAQPATTSPRPPPSDLWLRYIRGLGVQLPNPSIFHLGPEPLQLQLLSVANLPVRAHLHSLTLILRDSAITPSRAVADLTDDRGHRKLQDAGLWSRHCSTDSQRKRAEFPCHQLLEPRVSIIATSVNLDSDWPTTGPRKSSLHPRCRTSQLL
jgi:hypothetical protein